MPVLHVYHEVSGWPNKRAWETAWEQIVDIWPILLEFGPINDLLLFVTGRRWCRSLANVTKRVKIEKSNLFFVIPNISVIPYPYNFLVSYPLSLKPLTGPLYIFVQIGSFQAPMVMGSWSFLDILPNFNLLRTLELAVFGPLFPRIYGRHWFSLFQVLHENLRKRCHFLKNTAWVEIVKLHEYMSQSFCYSLCELLSIREVFLRKWRHFLQFSTKTWHKEN